MHATKQNWKITYQQDRQQRPSRLTVHLFPVFWRTDRRTKRAALLAELRAWLKDVTRQATKQSDRARPGSPR